MKMLGLERAQMMMAVVIIRAAVLFLELLPTVVNIYGHFQLYHMSLTAKHWYKQWHYTGLQLH